MTTHGLDRYRNYGTILERHQRDKKLRRIQRAFTYFLILLALMLILWWITSWEREGTTDVSTSEVRATTMMVSMINHDLG